MSSPSLFVVGRGLGDEAEVGSGLNDEAELAVMSSPSLFVVGSGLDDEAEVGIGLDDEAELVGTSGHCRSRVIVIGTGVVKEGDGNCAAASHCCT